MIWRWVIALVLLLTSLFFLVLFLGYEFQWDGAIRSPGRLSNVELKKFSNMVTLTGSVAVVSFISFFILVVTNIWKMIKLSKTVGNEKSDAGPVPALLLGFICIFCYFLMHKWLFVFNYYPQGFLDGSILFLGLCLIVAGLINVLTGKL